MIRRPPISTRTDPRFPYTTLFRSFVETPGLPDEADGSMQREIKSLLTVYRLAETPQWAAATALLAQSRKVQIAGFQTERGIARSEEHTSELQSLMRISYAVFCLKKKKTHIYHNIHTIKQPNT